MVHPSRVRELPLLRNPGSTFLSLRVFACREEVPVAFSRGGCGFRASCGARRMLGEAAHPVDRALPFVPFRQFVEAFPRSMKLRLAYDRECMKAARRIVVTAIFAWQRRKARALGLEKPHSGAISFVRRFSSFLACSPHVHLLVPDGVFVEGPDGAALFRAQPKRTVEDLEVIAARVVRCGCSVGSGAAK